MKSAGIGIATTAILILSVVIMVNLMLSAVIKNECVTALNTATYQTACYMYQSAEKPTETQIEEELTKYFKEQLPENHKGIIEKVNYNDEGMISAVGTITYTNLSGQECKISTKRTIVFDEE